MIAALILEWALLFIYYHMFNIKMVNSKMLENIYAIAGIIVIVQTIVTAVYLAWKYLP